MSDLTVAKKHLNALATTLSQMAPLTPPPSAKGRWVIVKAIPKVTEKATEYSKTLKEWLDGAVTKDEEGKPIYNTNGPQMAFEFPDESGRAQFNEIQDEQVTLEGVRQITRAELGDCPITVEQELVLVTSGFLDGSEPT